MDSIRNSFTLLWLAKASDKNYIGSARNMIAQAAYSGHWIHSTLNEVKAKRKVVWNVWDIWRVLLLKICKKVTAVFRSIARRLSTIIDATEGSIKYWYTWGLASKKYK